MYVRSAPHTLQNAVERDMCVCFFYYKMHLQGGDLLYDRTIYEGFYHNDRVCIFLVTILLKYQTQELAKDEVIGKIWT